MSIYYKELISKLAPNWLTNVKVIDLTVFCDMRFFKKLQANNLPSLSILYFAKDHFANY